MKEREKCVLRVKTEERRRRGGGEVRRCVCVWVGGGGVKVCDLMIYGG